MTNARSAIRSGQGIRRVGTLPVTSLSRGDILQAQYRLGHGDAATTLRLYCHVLPLTDADAAATLDRLYEL
jgi:hypothetical protein